MKAAVVVFPGSNCDADTLYVLKDLLGIDARYVWHGENSLHESTDLVVLPGGFSHGDYLRTGAMAARAPIMTAVRNHAAYGKPVLGICNGFQILLEAGLLPGAMLPNTSTQFRCEWVHIRVESLETPFSSTCRPQQVLRLPIAHGEGNYVIDHDGLSELQDQERIVYRYATAEGVDSPDANPNGSMDNIAGICSSDRNVVGMMPHPERASEESLGSRDGLKLWESVMDGIGD